MKRYIRSAYYSSSSDELDTFLSELAYETCDLEEEFDRSEFEEFKETCKINGYDVNRHDFEVYLNFVESIRYDNPRN